MIKFINRAILACLIYLSFKIFFILKSGWYRDIEFKFGAFIVLLFFFFLTLKDNSEGEKPQDE